MKAQFEAMGLAIAVVLISLGIFFLLFFSTTKGSDFSYRYDREQAAQNFVDAFLRTQYENCSHTMTELLEDTAVQHQDICGAPGSKVQFETAADQLLNETFRKRGIPFDLRIDTTTYKFEDESCNATTEQTDAPGKQPLFFFPAVSGNVTLYICIR